MRRRYLLSPDAVRDLAGIWHHVRKNASFEMADRVEAVIRQKFAYLSGTPGGGHWRKDLTDEPVRFFAVYSWLIVFLPDTKPLQIVAILHGHRDIATPLKDRL